MSLIPAFRRYRQVDPCIQEAEFKARLIYRTSSRTTKAIQKNQKGKERGGGRKLNEGLAVKGTYCSSKEPKIEFPEPKAGCSGPPVIPAQGIGHLASADTCKYPLWAPAHTRSGTCANPLWVPANAHCRHTHTQLKIMVFKRKLHEQRFVGGLNQCSFSLWP